MIPRLLIRGGLAFGGVIFALVIAEVTLRLAPRTHRYQVKQPHILKVFPELPSLIPGIFGVNHFTTNSEGMRGPEMRRDAREYRFLAIGGSTTEGRHVDDREVWTAILAQRLGRTADGRQTWIGNVGRAGLNARDHVMHAEYLTMQHPEIDALLILTGVNDLTIALARGEQYAAPPPVTDPAARRLMIKRAFASAPNHFVDYGIDDSTFEVSALRRFALWRWLRRTWKSIDLSLRDAPLTQDADGKYLTMWRDRRQHAARFAEQPPDMTTALTEYRRNLIAITDLAKARERRLVLMTQPSIWRANLPRGAIDRCWLGGIGDFQREQAPAYYTLEALAAGMDQFNDVLRDVARAHQVEVIDLATKVPKEESLFFDDVHFTEEGERLVGELIATQLAQTPPYAKQ